MPEKLIIFPFGGNARESLITISAINKIGVEWEIVGFIDDDSSSWGKECCGVKVLGGKEVLKNVEEASILAIPGNPDNYLKRKDIIKRLDIDNSRFATIIHPSVSVSNDSSIGYNTIIMPNVIISCGVKIGKHCIILPNSVVAHDSIIGDYCCIGSNVTISGNVTIGTRCYIGSGTSIRDSIKIDGKTLVGIGSNVVSDITESVVVAGNPAKIVRKVL
ncbi:MAG: acetyltransferase [Candidatus Scalindua sp.]|jgi:sugar O-acyltransferase (sialic acid O-acetyltransferase NeuD family)|nr:acetyltransferase [Candidatus Scalindua sp.]